MHDPKEQWIRELNLADIISERIHYKAAEESKLQYFSRLVVNAFGLLARVDKLLSTGSLTSKNAALVKEKADILRRILEENIEPNNNNPLSGQATYQQKPKEEKPKNRLVSAVDPDARHSAKSDKKHYMGHKTQYMITAKSQLIVNVEGISATESDGEALLAVADEALRNTDLTPQKVLADGQYTTIANFQGVQKRDIELVGNIKESANPKGGYPLSSFHYDPEQKTLTCPAGVVTEGTYRTV